MHGQQVGVGRTGRQGWKETGKEAWRERGEGQEGGTALKRNMESVKEMKWRAAGMGGLDEKNKGRRHGG